MKTFEVTPIARATAAAKELEILANNIADYLDEETGATFIETSWNNVDGWFAIEAWDVNNDRLYLKVEFVDGRLHIVSDRATGLMVDYRHHIFAGMEEAGLLA